MSPDARDDRDPLGLLPDFHRSTRMPLDAVVRLHFEGTVAYQNGFAANVSALGMFVKHPDPPPVGTRLVFEFVLGEERKPVQGAGVVSWAREKYEGPGRPAGVGIQFTELDALSRQHVAESLFEYLESQLGVEIADHPDVPDLLAAVPTRAGLDLEPAAIDEGPGGGEAPAGEPIALPTWTLADAEAELATDAPRAEGGFRLFADEPEPTAAPLDSEGLFAPVIPPDDSAAPRVREYATADEAGYGVAKQRDRSWAILAGVPLLVLAGGIAAWWFFAGPGARRDAEPPAAASAARRAPARPPLEALPAAGETLAQAVGGAPLAGAATPDAAAGTDEPAAAPQPPAPAAAPPSAAAAAPPSAAAAAPPARSSPARRARVERLTDIAWDSSPGSTVVTLVGDGPFVAGSFRWFEMGGDRPRVLVRLTGMAAGYARVSPAAVSSELAGIRVGFHEKPAGNELHVVLDLGSAAVRVESVEAAGELLVIRLAGG